MNPQPSTLNSQPSTPIHPACALCRGACCEIIGLDSVLPPEIRHNPWYKFRGYPTAVGTVLKSPCCKLVDGKCSIYSTRPRCCELAPVGDKGCRAAIHLLRAEQEAEIVALIEAVSRQPSAVSQPNEAHSFLAESRKPIADSSFRFSLIHPTRGRPLRCIEARDTWYDWAVHPETIEHIFAVDDDDHETIRALTDLTNGKHHKLVVVRQDGVRRGVCHAINQAYAASTGQIIILAADDQFPCKDWDAIVWERMRDAAEQNLPRALRTMNRLAVGKPDFERHCPEIVTRARIEQQGYFHFPGFHSMYADTDFWERAKRDGIVIDGRDILFEHRHVGLGAAPWDATYRYTNQEQFYTNGRKLFLERNPGANP